MKLAKTIALATTFAATALMAAPSMAQTPKPIKQHNAWGAYSYNDAQAGKICYILSIPTEKLPTDRDHGDVFFLVSQKPDGSGRFEPQVEVGYPLQANADVMVNVDGKEFKMFSQGNNAWLADVNQEPDLVAAMRAGRSMKVSGKSSRGTSTNYTYSLSGVTAALGDVANCKK
ncbi:MAG: invasion associated locus B family protein [Ahrensia sp.]|nr:invasion associated locus B family protein [Ahrensia sp.]